MLRKPELVGTVIYKRKTLRVMVGQYTNSGREAVMLETKIGQPFAVLSVNIPSIPIEDREILIKTWSENAEIAQFMKGTNYFVDTGKRFQTGFVEGEIWKWK